MKTILKIQILISFDWLTVCNPFWFLTKPILGVMNPTADKYSLITGNHSASVQCLQACRNGTAVFRCLLKEHEAVRCRQMMRIHSKILSLVGSSQETDCSPGMKPQRHKILCAVFIRWVFRSTSRRFLCLTAHRRPTQECKATTHKWQALSQRVFSQVHYADHPCQLWKWEEFITYKDSDVTPGAPDVSVTAGPISSVLIATWTSQHH